MKTHIACLLSSVALTSLAACGTAPLDPGTPSLSVDILSLNGLTPAALTENALARDGAALGGLVENSLTIDGVENTPAIRHRLDSDALARTYFSYVVSCALPAGQAIVFPRLAGRTHVTFSGSIGVAASWGHDGGSCDDTCQEWVSACVIARVNHQGVHVPLSLRGGSAVLALADREEALFPSREATYYGNVLTSRQVMFACRTTGDDWTLIGRPCGNGADVRNCVIDVVDPCESRCSKSFSDGSYETCATSSAAGATVFVPAVTVYRE
jgi:hypothetical protein